MELDPFIADIKRGLLEALNAQIDDYSAETAPTGEPETAPTGEPETAPTDEHPVNIDAGHD